jgi:hypothetical protein
MPIRISTADHSTQIAWLCPDDWDLARQIAELNAWLVGNGGDLNPGAYIADIGVVSRSDAAGGGAVISTQMMKMLCQVGMELWVSEYPNA